MPARAWELARRFSAPEDRGQQEFVYWLEKPIAANDRRGIVERYEALRVLFGTMGPTAAQRMHKRLTDRRDALGDFAKFELADWHRRELISMAGVRAKGLDRGNLDRGTQNQQHNQQPPVPPKDRGIPTDQDKKKDKPPVPIKDPPPTDVVPRPDPKSIYVNLDPNAPNWLETSLNAVARLGTYAISGLVALIPASVLEKAVQAAWLIYSLRGLTPAGLAGLAGEMAAEVIAVWVLETKMGIAAAKVFRLNSLGKNFPGLDLLAPNLPISVKTYGIVSKLSGEKLSRSLMARYKNDALFLFSDHDRRYVKYQIKTAKRLLQNKTALSNAGVWPALGNQDPEKKLVEFIRARGVMMVPDNHVSLVRSTMGREYFILYQQGKLPGFKPGLSDPVVAQQISDLVHRRFISSGLKVTDYRAISDVAGRLSQARETVVTNPRKRWPPDWGTPPTWSGAVSGSGAP